MSKHIHGVPVGVLTAFLVGSLAFFGGCTPDPAPGRALQQQIVAPKDSAAGSVALADSDKATAPTDALASTATVHVTSAAEPDTERAAQSTSATAPPAAATSAKATAPTHATAPVRRDTVAASPATAEAIAAGRAIFHGKGQCLMCHGAGLEGGIGPTLKAHAWKDARTGSYAAIYGVVTHGVTGTAMVAHPGGISDAMTREVAAYVWAVSHGKAKP